MRLRGLFNHNRALRFKAAFVLVVATTLWGDVLRAAEEFDIKDLDKNGVMKIDASGNLILKGQVFPNSGEIHPNDDFAHWSILNDSEDLDALLDIYDLDTSSPVGDLYLRGDLLTDLSSLSGGGHPLFSYAASTVAQTTDDGDFELKGQVHENIDNIANYIPGHGLIQFGAPGLDTEEGAGSVSVRVIRVRGTTGSVSVHYSVANGTAEAGSDFTATSGTITFGIGEDSKSFSIPIITDEIVEGSEMSTIMLDTPTDGAAIGTVREIPLKINELPPTLAEAQPTYDPAQPYSFLNAMSFLFDPNQTSLPNLTQNGMTAETVVQERASRIKGKVLDEDGLALQGVRITILGHPDFGYTISRSDGTYDMAVNGEQELTFQFSKLPLPSHELRYFVDEGEINCLEDVRMKPYSSDFHFLDFTNESSTLSIPVDIFSGGEPLNARLSISCGNRAIQISSPSSGIPIRTVNQLTIFETASLEVLQDADPTSAGIGPLTPDAYAIRLRLLESRSAEASLTSLETPAVLYLSNYKHYPLGQAIPQGSYASTSVTLPDLEHYEPGEWISGQEGRVLRTTGVDAQGKAILDLGLADGETYSSVMESLGITESELIDIAELYLQDAFSTDGTFWRLLVNDFGPSETKLIDPQFLEGVFYRPMTAEFTSDTPTSAALGYLYFYPPSLGDDAYVSRVYKTLNGTEEDFLQDETHPPVMEISSPIIPDFPKRLLTWAGPENISPAMADEIAFELAKSQSPSSPEFLPVVNARQPVRDKPMRSWIGLTVKEIGDSTLGGSEPPARVGIDNFFVTMISGVRVNTPLLPLDQGQMRHLWMTKSSNAGGITADIALQTEIETAIPTFNEWWWAESWFFRSNFVVFDYTKWDGSLNHASHALFGPGGSADAPLASSGRPQGVKQTVFGTHADLDVDYDADGDFDDNDDANEDLWTGLPLAVNQEPAEGHLPIESMRRLRLRKPPLLNEMAAIQQNDDDVEGNQFYQHDFASYGGCILKQSGYGKVRIFTADDLSRTVLDSGTSYDAYGDSLLEDLLLLPEGGYLDLLAEGIVPGSVEVEFIISGEASDQIRLEVTGFTIIPNPVTLSRQDSYTEWPTVKAGFDPFPSSGELTWSSNDPDKFQFLHSDIEGLHQVTEYTTDDLAKDYSLAITAEDVAMASFDVSYTGSGESGSPTDDPFTKTIKVQIVDFDLIAYQADGTPTSNDDEGIFEAGWAIPKNTDDDDGNGIPDYLDEGPLLEDDDDLLMGELQLRHPIDPSFRFPDGELSLSYSYYADSQVVLWKDRKKTERMPDIIRWSMPGEVPELPIVFYVEGLTGHDILRARYSGSFSPKDEIEIHVNDIDLDLVVTDPSGHALPGSDEEMPGCILPVNNDDDDANDVLDYLDGETAGENDLARLDVSFKNNGTGAGTMTLKFTNGASKVKLWETPDKTAEATLPLTWNEGELGSEFNQTYYVEAVEASDAAQDVKLSLEYTTTGFILPNATENVNLTAVKVTSVEWAPFTGQTLDENPNAKGGRRIYPDQTTPTDVTPRDIARCKAVVQPALAGVPVYFRVMDVDDATPNTDDPEFVIDANHNDGDDNFGDPGKLSSPTVQTEEPGATLTELTDTAGIAIVKLTTGMQPGDNYRIAATVVPDDNARLSTDVLSSYCVPNGQETMEQYSGQLTEMLTVWRHLWYEFDSMGNPQIEGTYLECNYSEVEISSIAPHAQEPTQYSTLLTPYIPFSDTNQHAGGAVVFSDGSICKINSDEHITGLDYNYMNITLNGVVPTTLSGMVKIYDDDWTVTASQTTLKASLPHLLNPGTLLEEAFHTAYVFPISVPVEFIQLDVPFRAFSDADYNAADFQNSSDFWYANMLASWQYNKDEDFDPINATLGVTDFGLFTMSDAGDHGAIFIEVLREWGGVNSEAKAIVHEIGHTRGLRHNKNSLGIMEPEDRGETFTNKEILHIRSNSLPHKNEEDGG